MRTMKVGRVAVIIDDVENIKRLRGVASSEG